jgi:hypothetical protein
MLPGLDLLGGPCFTRTAAGAYPAGWAVGCFWDFFGSGEKFCDAMYAAGCRIFRIQGTWDPNHDYGSGYRKLAIENAKEVNAWSLAHKDAQVFYSPYCEHPHPKSIMLPLFTDLIKVANNITYVNSILRSPKRNGEEVPGIITEVHNSAPVPKNRPYLFSFDGEDANESDVTAYKKKHAGAQIFFLWNSRFNGKFEADDEAKPVHKRTGWPDRKLIQSIQYLWNAIGEVSKLPERYLSKSHAENNGEGDRKAEKYCLIIPSKLDRIDLYDIRRIKIATMRREASPRIVRPWSKDKPGWRYYADKWGFEISEMARIKSGSPIVIFDVDKKRFRVNPAFRTGFY